MKKFAVVGGGPAGYSVAMFLAKQGMDVTLFEKDLIGGTCLNKGCIPTKAMLYCSEIYKQLFNLARFGIDVEIKSFDFSKVVEHRNGIVEKVRKSLELAIKNSGVKIINMEFDINDNKGFDEIINCTGSKPKEIKGLEFDHDFIMSSDDLLYLKELPKSILIIGSGAIGIEWARIFFNFGVETSIVELADHLIPIADTEVSKRIERIFKQNGIKYYLNTCVDKIENKKVYLKNGVFTEPDKILVAVGREVNKYEQYGCLGETVLGDACKEIQLAHYGIHQAKSFACKIDFDKTLVPSIIYGEPEIAWIGKREQDLEGEFRKINLPVSALGKAWCDCATEGFIKLLIQNNKIAGAHVVSKNASALIHEILIAMQNNVSVDCLKKTCFAHPTFSEGIFEALMRL